MVCSLPGSPQPQERLAGSAMVLGECEGPPLPPQPSSAAAFAPRCRRPRDRTLQACAKATEWDQALDLWCRLIREPLCDHHERRCALTALLNSLANASTESRVHVEALMCSELQRGWPPEGLPAFKIGLRVIADTAEWQRSVALLKRQADSASYTIVINATAQGTEWKLALELLKQAEMACAVDGSAVNLAMNACVQASHWTKALHLLKRLQPLGSAAGALLQYCRCWVCKRYAVGALPLAAQPSLISYNVAMSACEKASRWEPWRQWTTVCDIVGLKELARPKASKVRKRPVGCFFTSFLRLRGHSVGPHNACTFILRSADTFSCLKVSALALLEEMVSRKHSPSMASYGAAAAGLEKAAKGHKALNLLERRGATSGLSGRSLELGHLSL
ncbi:unnamed protein product [Durusdinium trenchii]|uniref:Pentatricopeptide repeat-containing protein, chloroplastic n=1 Tax=Durusdinium trenchii TaxID=1381693 RepID=A0ABP0QWG7_9DINO